MNSQTHAKHPNVTALANTEIEDIADYISSDCPDAGTRFLLSIEKAITLICEQPGIGSLRYAQISSLNGLRFWPVPDFSNYLVFYIERSETIDVIRVLHGKRDLPRMLRDNSD